MGASALEVHLLVFLNLLFLLRSALDSRGEGEGVRPGTEEICTNVNSSHQIVTMFLHRYVRYVYLRTCHSPTVDTNVRRFKLCVIECVHSLKLEGPEHRVSRSSTSKICQTHMLSCPARHVASDMLPLINVPSVARDLLMIVSLLRWCVCWRQFAAHRGYCLKH